MTKMALYYLSYLMWLLVPLILWWALKQKRERYIQLTAFSFCFVLCLGIWARFIEPRILTIEEHEIEICTPEEENFRIAVFSDTHIGIFKNAMPMARIVEAVAQQNPDFVLIPGDFTYHLNIEEFEIAFGSLKELKVPVVAVMGNHDEGIPGPDLTDALRASLEASNVIVLDGEKTRLKITGKETAIDVYGMVDYWAAKRDARELLDVMREESETSFTIFLQHNPDAILKAQNYGRFDLMVAGHTHGGQVNIPLITCAMTFACEVSRYGYKETPYGNLFVTSGTGMIGLPIRFNVPPVVDMLNVTTKKCKVTT